jgi:hypothetical protein
LLTSFLVFHHEPWRDEADGWLATRDATPAQLLRFTNYVGVPGLWFWLQLPLSRFGAPYVSLGLLNLLFAAAAVALVLWRAPFPLWLRVGFAFGYFASYEYAVIARSYALAMALIFALAAAHTRRWSRPWLHGVLLFLLFNTNLHGALIGAPILALLAWEAWRAPAGPLTPAAPGAQAGGAWGGVALALAGLLLAVVQLWPPADGQMSGLAPLVEL